VEGIDIKVALLRAGVSQQQLAQELHIHRATLSTLLKYGVSETLGRKMLSSINDLAGEAVGERS